MFITSSAPIDEGATLGIGNGRNCFYALSTLGEFEVSRDVVSGMLQLFSHNSYVLLDLGSTLSCV